MPIPLARLRETLTRQAAALADEDAVVSRVALLNAATVLMFATQTIQGVLEQHCVEGHAAYTAEVESGVERAWETLRWVQQYGQSATLDELRSRLIDTNQDVSRALSLVDAD